MLFYYKFKDIKNNFQDLKVITYFNKMSLYGIGLDVEVKRIILKLKLNISKRKACLYTLRKIFKGYDKEATGKLSSSTFEEALADFGLFTTQVEQQALAKYFG